ncbi:MAG: sigma-54 dependent transcriptional regulator [Candidatus Eisenbacteria bacterium]
MSEPTRILVVDDEPLIREFLGETLKRQGYEVLEATGADDAIGRIEKITPDIVLLDIRMKGRDGLSFLPEVKQMCPDSPVLMMTGHGTVESAVQAMRLGAFDYLTKPFSADVVELAVERAAALRALRRENASLRGQLSMQAAVDTLVGRSRPMDELRSTIRHVAPSPSTVLIQGESGTGKELVARAIHEGSSRASGAFVKINCAAVPPGLLESELFGHEKGAFTGASQRTTGRFEQADGGTLLLDEISEMEPSLQPKLLRVLQEREFYRVGGREMVRVDVRVIATTNADLRDRVKQGTFREDLYYRLNVVPIRLQPLRERREDIPLLAGHYLGRGAAANGKPGIRMGRAAMELLLTHDWPGNVRELINAVERAVILCPGDEVLPEHLVLDLGISNQTPMQDVGDTLAEREKAWILEILDQESQNRTRTAKRLGVSVRTIRNKLALYARQDAEQTARDREQWIGAERAG